MSLTAKKLAEIILAIVAIALIVGVVLCFTTPLGDAFSGIFRKQHEVANGDIWQEGNYDMPYTVKLTTNDPNMGTAAFAGEYDGLTSVSLKGEQTVTVKATSNGGYTFVGWYEGDTLLSTDAEYSFSATGKTNIEARFEINCEDFTVTSSNRAKVGYTGTEGENLVIPEKFEDNGTWYKVTAIGNNAFQNCTNLSSVEIPDSVTSIGDYAFSLCSGLTGVEIPGTVTSIGRSVFANCTGLTSVEIPGSVTSIGQQAFNSCTGLTSVEIPESVTTIGNNAFYDCTGLTGVYYEGTLEQWCNISFGSYGNPCNKGAALYIGGELADDIVIPSSVTEIKAYTFIGCTSLTSVEIPHGVTAIGNGAFSSCTGLTSIEIPTSVTSIGEGTFAGCTSLESITIPDSVTTIGGSAFNKCTNLKTVYYEGTLEQWCNITFAAAAANPCTNGAALYIDGELVDDLVIPSTITEIKQFAFYKCTSLTSVEIPDSVTTIGQTAFSSCKNLKAVYYEGTLEQWCNISFGSYGGNPCANGAALYIGGELADDIVIPSTVTEIKKYVFQGCTGLKNIEIPANVTSVGSQALYECTGLQSITIHSEIMVPYSTSMLYKCNALTAIYVPADLVDDYQAASGWSSFAAKIQAIQ